MKDTTKKKIETIFLLLGCILFAHDFSDTAKEGEFSLASIMTLGLTAPMLLLLIFFLPFSTNAGKTLYVIVAIILFHVIFTWKAILKLL